MSAEQLIVISGAILSLSFSYIPGLKTRYEPLGDEMKRLVMLGLLVLVVAGGSSFLSFLALVKSFFLP